MKTYLITFDEKQTTTDPRVLLSTIKGVVKVVEKSPKPHQAIGANWHIPTEDQIEQLISEAEIESLGLDLRNSKDVLNNYIDDSE